MTNIYYWGKPISTAFDNNNQNIRNHSNHQNYQNYHINQQDNILSNISSISTDIKIVKAKCGNNQLYGFGSNQHGQLGLTSNPHKYIDISRILISFQSPQLKPKIIDISCGWHHTLILDSLQNLYSSGKSTSGETGQGIRQDSFTFKLILSNITKISAGYDHSLAIQHKNNSNKVYGWGSTKQGQLGLHSKKNFLIPTELNVYPCKQIYAGAKYSVFLTVKGVYLCGENSNYQLGLGHQKNINYAKKLQIEGGPEIVQIWQNNYCFGKTSQNTYYIWGSGAFGIFKYPTKIPFFNGCNKFSLGHNFGIVEKDNKIFVWGSNTFNELGLSTHESKGYVVENQQLSGLELDNFCSGGNFTIGFSYSKKNYLENKRKKELLVKKYNNDGLNQNYQNQCYSDQNSQNFKVTKSQKSFYSLYNGQNMKNTNMNMNKNKYLKNSNHQNNMSVSQCNDYKNKMKRFEQGQEIISLKNNNKSTSNITIKKHGPNFNNMNSKYSHTQSHEDQQVMNQLNDIKTQIMNQNSQTLKLSQQNLMLKQMMKQQLLKQLMNDNNRNSLPLRASQSSQTSQQQLHNLRSTLYHKDRQILYLREQYNKVSNMLQNSQFYRNVLNLKQTSVKSSQRLHSMNIQDEESEKLENFGNKLHRLKQILENIDREDGKKKQQEVRRRQIYVEIQ